MTSNPNLIFTINLNFIANFCREFIMICSYIPTYFYEGLYGKIPKVDDERQHIVLYKEIEDPVDKHTYKIKPIYRIYTGKIPKTILGAKTIKINDSYAGFIVDIDNEIQHNDSQYKLENVELHHQLTEFVKLLKKAPIYNPENSQKNTVLLVYTYN